MVDGPNLYAYLDSVGKLILETNLYTYTGNDPINRVDPLGLYWGEDQLNWWFYESVLPGPYGEPMSEWGSNGPTGWGDPIKYTECAGGGWQTVERAAVGTAAAATAIVTLEGTGAFARGGWLNNNPYFRIGWGWKGSSTIGKFVFRIAIGGRNMPIWWHIDLF